MEDDVDWDIRIKSQMKRFAAASRIITRDPPLGNEDIEVRANDTILLRDNTTDPSVSPYGDVNRWDILWVGHCGNRFPPRKQDKIPSGRVVFRDDVTVPEHQHIDTEFGNNEIFKDYPDHTRVVARAFLPVCSLSYGMSQMGARRLLYELSMNKMTGPKDMMYRAFCDGMDDRKGRTCVSIQPQLFQHHRPAGDRSRYSDIDPKHAKEGENKVAFTHNIRWSTRLNVPKLIDGATDFTDPYTDGKNKPKHTDGKDKPSR